MDDGETGERDLVRRCLAWDERAWEELACRYGRLVASRAAGILAARLGRADPDAVQEAVQEAFLRLAADRGRLLARFAWRSRLSTYIGAVAGFAALDQVRRLARAEGRRTHLSVPVEAVAGEAPDPARILMDAEAAARVASALDGLSARERLVVRMRFWDGAEAGAIARVLDLDPAYVRVILARALEKIGKILSSPDAAGGVPPTHG